MGRGSRPAGDFANCGASAVAAHVPSQPKGSHHVAQQHSHKHRVHHATTRTAKRRNVGPALRRRKTKHGNVLALLKHRKGTTIAGIIKATGWQDHSVRSFLVTIVLKKLGFALSSETVDGARVYRITGPIASSGPERSRKDVKHRSMRPRACPVASIAVARDASSNDDLQHRAINHVDRQDQPGAPEQ